MGERIRDLANTYLRGNEVRIELNEGQSSLTDYDIHIEAPMFRFSMADAEFMRFAYGVMEARRKIMNTKDLGE